MWYVAAMRRAILMLAATALLIGCGDDDHKGSPSVGPAPSASAKEEPRVQLVYNPKTPIATARVASIFKRRLAAIGLGDVVKIGGRHVHVNVPAVKVEEAKKALSGGRADVWLTTTTDPLGLLDEPPKGLSLKEETVRLPKGETKIHFLQGPPDKRAALTDLGDAAAGANVLTGLSFEGGATARTFLVQPDRKARGEFVTDGEVEEIDGKPVLAVTFNAAGKSFVRWNTKQGERFVLQIDGEVVGTAHSDVEVKDGVLRFSVGGRTKAQVAKLAEAIAKSRAVSHEVELEEKAP